MLNCAAQNANQVTNVQAGQQRERELDREIEC